MYKLMSAIHFPISSEMLQSLKIFMVCKFLVIRYWEYKSMLTPKWEQRDLQPVMHHFLESYGLQKPNFLRWIIVM